MTDTEYLNSLCTLTTSPTVLNALRACRPGHPLNHDNAWRWRNAYSLVMKHPVDFLGADLRRLASRAATEGLIA